MASESGISLLLISQSKSHNFVNSRPIQVSTCQNCHTCLSWCSSLRVPLKRLHTSLPGLGPKLRSDSPHPDLGMGVLVRARISFPRVFGLDTRGLDWACEIFENWIGIRLDWTQFSSWTRVNKICETRKPSTKNQLPFFF